MIKDKIKTIVLYLGSRMYYRNSYTTNSEIRVAVDFGARPKRFGSSCFVCQTKKLNSSRHIPESLVGQSLAKSSEGVQVNQNGEIYFVD